MSLGKPVFLKGWSRMFFLRRNPSILLEGWNATSYDAFRYEIKVLRHESLSVVQQLLLYCCYAMHKYNKCIRSTRCIPTAAMKPVLFKGNNQEIFISLLHYRSAKQDKNLSLFRSIIPRNPTFNVADIWRMLHSYFRYVNGLARTNCPLFLHLHKILANKMFTQLFILSSILSFSFLVSLHYLDILPLLLCL